MSGIMEKGEGMILAKLRVTGVKACVVEACDIPRGIIGGQVEIVYDDPVWDGLTKTVVIKGSRTRDIVNAGERVSIPAECVDRAMPHLYIGVYGTDAAETIAIPTLWADVGPVHGAADPSGEESTEESLPVWAQILSAMGDLSGLNTQAKDSLVAAINEALTKGGGTVEKNEIQQLVAEYLRDNPPESGQAGFSPVATVTQSDTGAVISITDVNGTTTASVANGRDGEKGDTGAAGSRGADGISPVVEVSKSGKVTTITITDASGTKTATIHDGEDGMDGGSSGSSNIPSYWQEHISEKITAIRALQDAGGRDAVSFVVMTDLHYHSNLGKRAPSLARKIMDTCGIKYALVLGDTQNRGSWTTKALAEEEFAAVEEMLSPIAGRMLRTQGNHDGSWGAVLNGLSYPYNYTPEELYSRIYRRSHLLGGIHTDTSGTGYYVDDNAARMRYIVLNTHCNEYGENEDGSALYNNQTVFRFTQSQYDMVVDALGNMPGGYSVAVFAHVPISNDYAELFGGSNGDHTVMRGLLTAYKTKTAYSGSFAGTAGSGGAAAYTNVAGTITMDVRLSSSGSTKASAGAAVTDYIACKQGDILRVKGLDLKTTLPDGTNNPSIVMYTSEKASAGAVYTGTTVADAVTTDTDGSTMYTLAVNNNGVQLSGSENMAYIRICGTPTGGDIIVTLNEQIVETSGEAGYDAVSVDVDFSTAKGEFVGYFSGHMHKDLHYANKDWGIDIITTRCDAQEENDSALNAERVAGTITEQSFDVFTVNTKERKIYATKIGAGSDREVSY